MTVPGPDDPTPDSAMASGTDPGTAGGHLGPGDLTPSEERLLAALERDVDRWEPDVAEVRAAEDEAPLPARGGLPTAGLVPRFEAPGEA
ncbi:hypothetical protein [Blastococcus sp. CCUG 61487]|uniref:hypothetical protein n=1 Tax=Blastococcus sp. CCUG 61487 TaxID=1840703 RepID=UPI001139846B|nr:hypothetical protein [Blastococcus sp. CCUG 61487]TKJ33612.1 hypothetical protein A6V29_15805 [Blastococcus sp. CCUG 61487]